MRAYSAMVRRRSPTGRRARLSLAVAVPQRAHCFHDSGVSADRLSRTRRADDFGQTLPTYISGFCYACHFTSPTEISGYPKNTLRLADRNHGKHRAREARTQTVARDATLGLNQRIEPQPPRCAFNHVTERSPCRQRRSLLSLERRWSFAAIPPTSTRTCSRPR